MRGHDRRRAGAGQTVALFAVLLPGLIAGVGLGVDGANLALSYRDAQNAADLAALAGARTLSADAPSNADYTNARVRAVAVAGLNGFGTGVTATSPYDVNGDGDIDNGTTSPDERHHVEVVIDSATPMYFMAIAGISTMDVGVRALAGSAWTATGGTVPAIFAGCSSISGTSCTDPGKAIDWSGSNATIVGGTHSNCGILVGGSGNNTSGTSQSGTCGSSSWNTGNNSYSPSPASGGARQPYPFSYTASSFAPCTFTRSGTMELKNYYKAPTSAKVLQDGVYCATGSSALIKLDEGGVTGNVTLVSEQKIEISGSDFTLTAYHSSKVLMWANGTGDGVIKIAGSNGEWTGLIMAPRGQVEISGSSNSTVGGGSIIADRVKLAGQFINIDSNGLSVLGPSTLEWLRLVE